MVALLEKLPSTSKSALRARGAASASESRRADAIKSCNRIELGRFTYDACRRLGLCSNERIRSNETIGYLDAGGPGIGFYMYVENAPIVHVDPSGKVTLREAGQSLRDRGIWNPSPQQVFDEWIRLELALAPFWTNLSKCPCKLTLDKAFCILPWRFGVVPVPLNPDPTTWDDPIEPNWREEVLHPGIAFSMRSKNGPPFNQCTYDDKGKLMTNPPQAGTVDLKTPGTLPHLRHDVEPIGMANKLDGGCHVNWSVNPFSSCKLLCPPGPNMMKYYAVRPAWSQSCPANPTSCPK